MEAHRKEWACMFCATSTTTLHEFVAHLSNSHKALVKNDQIDSIGKLESQPLRLIPASACPFCNYSKNLKSISSALESGSVTLPQFQRYVAHHLEQAALFVLPEVLSPGAPGNDMGSDEESEADGICLSEDHVTADAIRIASKSPGELISAMALDNDESSASAPNFTLGWQPPHDLTPPTLDIETSDPELVPRREESMFGGDLFTPGWVRGFGKKKEGLCTRCEVGYWANLPDGTYEFHLTFLHGLPKTRVPLPRPSMIRKVSSEAGV